MNAIDNSRVVKTGRLEGIDIARGIGILLMVIGHSPSFYPHVIKELIYSFHMPFFFILSGYCFNEKTRFGKEYLLKKIRRLVVPYFVFSIIFLAIRILVYQICQELLDIRQYMLNIFINGYGTSTEWFFLCIFWVEIIFSLLWTNFNEKNVYGGVIILFTIGQILSLYGLHLPYVLDIAFTAIFFFAVGHLVRKYDITASRSKGYIIFLLLLWAMGFVAVYQHSGFVWELVLNQNGNTYLGGCTAICGSLLTMKLSMLFDDRKLKTNWLLKVFGIYSLIIYPLSKFLPDSLKMLFKYFGHDGILDKLLILILSILITWAVIFVKKRVERKTA